MEWQWGVAMAQAIRFLSLTWEALTELKTQLLALAQPSPGRCRHLKSKSVDGSFVGHYLFFTQLTPLIFHFPPLPHCSLPLKLIQIKSIQQMLIYM